VNRTVKQARLALNYFISQKCGNQQPYAINTEKFINFIAEEMKWDLCVETIPNMDALRGLIVKDKKNSKALILVSEKNNTCWKRFTSIKESCHLFLEYEESDQCDNALEMAQALVLQTKYAAGFLPNDCIDGSTDNFEKTLPEQIKATILEDIDVAISEPEFKKALYEKHEAAAVVAAIEIMIPEHHRQELLDKYDEFGLRTLAEDLKVPSLILEYRLDDWAVSIGN